MGSIISTLSTMRSSHGTVLPLAGATCGASGGGAGSTGGAWSPGPRSSENSSSSMFHEMLMPQVLAAALPCYKMFDGFWKQSGRIVALRSQSSRARMQTSTANPSA